MIDFVNRNYYAVLMTNNTDWTKTLGHNLRTLAKAALGFYATEGKAAVAAAR